MYCCWNRKIKSVDVEYIGHLVSETEIKIVFARILFSMDIISKFSALIRAITSAED